MVWTGSGVIRMGHPQERDKSSVNWGMMGKWKINNMNMFLNIIAYYKYFFMASLNSTFLISF